MSKNKQPGGIWTAQSAHCAVETKALLVILPAGNSKHQLRTILVATNLRIVVRNSTTAGTTSSSAPNIHDENLGESEQHLSWLGKASCSSPLPRQSFQLSSDGRGG